ncbi:MAG: type II secretion system protein [Hahellaceae bacterium]|nr:type II secretion system protein [Hahellaceae bacterium]MCP5168586.1 type II secretion system protein [Hahellaceae bacterium]
MKKQAGFTMIELVMVIVILGILAAFALPRFADLGTDARKASISGVIGSMKSASAIVHAGWLAGGSSGTTLTMDGGVVISVNGSGYAASQGVGTGSGADAANAGHIGLAAGISAGDYTITPGAATLTVALTGLTCTVTYTAASGAVTSAGADCP